MLALLLTVIAGTTALQCSPESPTSNSANNSGDQKENSLRIDESGIIDIHAHIGEFKGYDLTLTTLLKNVGEHKIDFVFFSNIDGAAVAGRTADADELKVNEEAARVAAENPQLKPLVWAKPGAPNASAANIEPFLRDKRFYGIKFHPDFNSFSANSPAVAPYLKMCEKYKVPAIFHCGKSERSNPRVLYEVARQYPSVPFVFYHMGFNSTHEEAIEVARTAKEKKDAIIYLETAQVDAATVIKAIQTVGSDRVVFGTDATYYGRNHYEHYAPILREIKQKLAAADYQKFIRGNALELFHLEERSTAPATK